MNAARYRSYRSARATIAVLPLDPVARALLYDSAEGMLLARSAEDDDVDESCVCMSSVLQRAVAADQLDVDEAEDLMHQIERCGRSTARRDDERHTPPAVAHEAA